jgi:formate dehydrogenase major subunit
MNAPLDPAVAAESIEFTLDGQPMKARVGETIIQAAARQGVDIPHLCYKDGYRPDGNCRACVVEIEGERVLAPSCCRAPTPGMKVKAESERAVKAQKMVVELLLSDMPEKTYKPDSELAYWAGKLGVTDSRFEAREQPPCDESHPAMSVNLDACIQCNRCVRACREEQGNDVIGYAFRGSDSKIVFDQDDPMGALDLRGLRRMRAGLPDRRADASRRCRHGEGRQEGRFGLPVLRHRLPADLSRQGRQDPDGDRP